jgi:hypothetical protein
MIAKRTLKTLRHTELREFLRKVIQSDQKEKKSEQALQIIGHVVADSMQISVQRMGMHER